MSGPQASPNQSGLHPRPVKRRWVGRWLMAVATLHSVYAGFAYSGPLATIFGRGIVNAVDPATAEAAWFILCGLVFFLLGLGVDHIEKSEAVPVLLGWGLLVLGGIGAILMPSGGFWLFFPPGLFVVISHQRAH